MMNTFKVLGAMMLVASSVACVGSVERESTDESVAQPTEGSEVAPAGRRVCRYTCRMENGIEVCRGSGPECNGVDP